MLVSFWTKIHNHCIIYFQRNEYFCSYYFLKFSKINFTLVYRKLEKIWRKYLSTQFSGKNIWRQIVWGSNPDNITDWLYNYKHFFILSFVMCDTEQIILTRGFLKILNITHVKSAMKKQSYDSRC